MKKLLSLIIVAVCVAGASAAIKSPNGKITVTERGHGLVVCYGQQVVLDIAEVAGTDIRLSYSGRVKDDYMMLAGKRSHCQNVANEYRSGGLTLRLYNDGIAFRLEADGPEQTAYRIADGTRRWMQRWTDSYEGFFPLTTTSRDGRWGYPALLEPQEGTFVLLTEANIERGQSASSLRNEGDLFRVVADDPSVPTPWRVAIIGTLADVVQSTLVTDVSAPCALADTSWIRPGTVSWIYWAYNHGSNDINIIRKYVDMAQDLRLPYVLIDAEWDQMKEGHTIEEAIAYAKERGVRPMIWYNSSVGWVNGAPTPKFRLNKPEDREREFAWCEQLGVAGVKVDFFSGDNRMNMEYCIELMECAARHHLLINFHGATVPRGWQRTYPNLMTTEGVYGAEWYNNVPTFTRAAAAHNATLPFTRNVIGPMDYTPCTFSDSQHPHITTHAHELALTVLFESGLQHLADRPESYMAQPEAVRRFLSELPTAWDETRLVGGYPGQCAVIARRHGRTWYVAGINGTDEPMTLPLQLGFIGRKKKNITLFADGAEPATWSISNVGQCPKSLECKARGGFVMVVE